MLKGLLVAAALLLAADGALDGFAHTHHLAGYCAEFLNAFSDTFRNSLFSR